MVDSRDQHLECARLVARWRGHVLDDRLVQRRQIGRGHVEIGRRHAIAGGRVDHRGIELCVFRLELDEEVEHLVMHSQGIRAGTIDLVDDDDRCTTKAQCFA